MSSNSAMNTVKMVLALPAYQIANLVTYVSQKQGVAARVASAAVFLPIVLLTTAIWAFCWVAMLWLLYRAVY